MHIQNHHTSAGFVVNSCGGIEDIGAEVGILLCHSLVAVQEIDGATGYGVVEFVADFRG